MDGHGFHGLPWIFIEILLIRYGDLAVGAPYSGVDGAGTVFIFRGGRTGVREDPDQVIALLVMIIVNVMLIVITIAVVMIINDR